MYIDALETPDFIVYFSIHFLNNAAFSLLITILSSLHPFNLTLSLELKKRLIFLILFILAIDAEELCRIQSLF